MIRHPQEDHADLGIVEDDNTPEMRKPPADTRGLQLEQRSPTTKAKEKKFNE